MGAEEGQLMWLHCVRIWPQPHMHMSFSPRTLARSVFCAPTCNGSIAEAIPMMAEKISARLRRFVKTRARPGVPSGVKTPDDERAFMSRLKPRPTNALVILNKLLN